MAQGHRGGRRGGARARAGRRLSLDDGAALEGGPPDPSETVAVAHAVRGDGPPILLVTGTGYPGATWPEPFLAGLAAHHTVVLFDHRGTGATPGTDGDYTTRLFAADAVRLLDELGIDRAHVLGHSMGGRVAQWIALDAPARVRSLVLAASGPGALDPARQIERGIPLRAAIQMIELGYERYIAFQMRSTLFTPELEAAMPEVVAATVASFWDHRPSLEDYLKHVVARQRHQTTHLLVRLRQPTLCLVGDRDTHRGGTGSHLEQSVYLAAHLPRAELAVIPRAAHGYFWSHPAESLEILLPFLARN